jgi:zinc/manganese transport system substrate-binding protein
MRRMIFSRCFISLALLITALPAWAKLSVFACEPEWAALAHALGGEQVEIFTATTALQDPHHVEARPSLIAKMRNADLLVCAGAELEVGWLPLLLRQSANARIQPGQPGYFMAAEQVDLLESLPEADRSMGDVHAAGNPHVHLDPHRVLKIAAALRDRLAAIDSAKQAVYHALFSEFSADWSKAIPTWEAQAAALKDKAVIVHHRNWTYLFNWLNVRVVADLEPKPGLPPSSSHLASLVELVAREKPELIAVAAYQNPKGATWLSKKTELPVAVLPFTVGGNEASKGLFELYQSTLSILLSNVAP